VISKMEMRIIACILTVVFLYSSNESVAQQFPQSNWQYNLHPENSNWDTARFKKLREFIIDSTQVTGMMIIYKGSVVFEYGDVVENSYIASCRKSILAMLYGKYVQSGKINLKTTLSDLNIDDVGGLLPIEKEATIKDILQARSGVFHEASYSGDYLEYAPKRGSVKPGSYWLYSNWDFNVAGYIFEKKTGKNIYHEIIKQLVRPLKMQDWRSELQKKEGDSTRSFYPAYPIWLSTRDMARVGLLMLNKGRWNGRQVINEWWVKEMTTPVTSYSEVNKNTPAFRGSDFYFGYGLYWWIWQNTNDPRFTGGYSALGAGGQSISIFPSIDAVVVYKTKDIYGRETAYAARFYLLRKAVQCFQIQSE
jgi:CubicO group peptidase (beta-lactamase class C family)